MADSHTLLKNCLYFTANALARDVTRMAEDAFKPTGLSPSHAFLLMIAIELPGSTPTDLAAQLRLAPSTVTRLIDKLLQKGLVEKRSQGKNAFIHPTAKGKKMSRPIGKAWKSLYNAYSSVLGEQNGVNLTRTTHEASEKLKQP
jgi:DNA-binding MarR family transcriptional regulator